MLTMPAEKSLTFGFVLRNLPFVLAYAHLTGSSVYTRRLAVPY